MTLKQFQSLRKFAIAKRNAPRAIHNGKRAVKSRAKGYGQWLKNSRVHSMSVETQHTQR